MMMYEEYQEADDVITFNHIIDIKNKSVKDGISEKFSTCFESTTLEWNAGIRHSSGGIWFISVIGFGRLFLYPPAKRYSFKLSELDSNGNVIRSLRHSSEPIFTGERFETSGYYAEDIPGFKDALHSWMEEAVKNDKMHLQLETSLEFRRAEFGSSKYMVEKEAPIVMDQSAYFFNALTNKNRHDFKLITSNGNHFLMTNKEILWAACPFFRPILKTETNEHIVGGASSVECIDICLTFVVTGKYKKPAYMTPTLAREVISVVDQWMPHSFENPLKKSIEKHAYEALCENHDDLMFVIDFMIVADDNNLRNLKTSCMATIISYHYGDFVRLCVHGDVHLKNRLARPDHSEKSLAMHVESEFLYSRRCRSFLKFIPKHGED